jgi:hypothetical protein
MYSEVSTHIHYAGISDFNFAFAQNHMAATLWCQARITVVSNLVRNVPLLTSLEMSPFGFDLLFLSSLALPAAEPCAA